MNLKNFSYFSPKRRFQIGSLFLPLFLLHQLCLCLFLCDVLHTHPEEESCGDAVSAHSGFMDNLPEQEDCHLERCRQNNLVPPESGFYGKTSGQNGIAADFLPSGFRNFAKITVLSERYDRIPIIEKLYLRKHVLRC